MEENICKYCHTDFVPTDKKIYVGDISYVTVGRSIDGKNLMNNHSDSDTKISVQISTADGKPKLRVTYDGGEDGDFFNTIDSQNINYCPVCGRRLDDDEK